MGPVAEKDRDSPKEANTIMSHDDGIFFSLKKKKKKVFIHHLLRIL